METLTFNNTTKIADRSDMYMHIIINIFQGEISKLAQKTVLDVAVLLHMP